MNNLTFGIKKLVFPSKEDDYNQFVGAVRKYVDDVAYNKEKLYQNCLINFNQPDDRLSRRVFNKAWEAAIADDNYDNLVILLEKDFRNLLSY